MSEINFFKNINLEKIQPIYYISGNNSWLKQRCLNKIIKEINNQKAKCEIYNFEGKNISINEVIDICESIPFGCDFKCIIIKDWELDKISDREMKVLIDIFSDIASFCSIIIVNMNISILKTKIKKLIDIIKKEGMLIEVTNPSPADIVDFIIFEIKKNNCDISKINAKKLMEYCSSDLNKISQEIDKLAAYCQDREIKLEDINLLVVPSLEIRVFDMIKFINNKNKKAAIDMLKDLLENKEEPVAILSIMSMSFLDVYRAKIAKQNNKTPKEVIELFDYKGKEFRVNKAFLESEKYSFGQLKRIINLFIEADYKLKTSSLDKKTLLEETLIKLFKYLEAR